LEEASLYAAGILEELRRLALGDCTQLFDDDGKFIPPK
jgi:hypothetical protein